MARKIKHKIVRLIVFIALLSGIIITPLAQCQQAPQYVTSSGNFIIKITNDSESAVPLQNVFVNYSEGPNFLHVPQSQGPIASISVGAVTNFTFPYTIDSDAPDGTYTAHFTVVPQNTPNSESPDGSMDVSVDFNIDAAPPVIKWSTGSATEMYTCSISTPGQCGTVHSPKDLTSAYFLYQDNGSGLKDLRIYKNDIGGTLVGEQLNLSGSTVTYKFITSMNFEDGAYAQTITNNLGKTTTMYFRVDNTLPQLGISSITVASNVYTVHTVAQDTGSGLVAFNFTIPGSTPVLAPLTAGTTESVNHDFTGTVGLTDYAILVAQDKVANSKLYAIMFPTDNGYDTLNNPNVLMEQVTGIMASGKKDCQITLTSHSNSPFAGIPVNYAFPDSNYGSMIVSLSTTTEGNEYVPVELPVNRYLNGNVSMSVTQENYTENGETKHRDACQVFVYADKINVAIGTYQEVSYSTPTWLADGAEFVCEGVSYPAGSVPGVSLSIVQAPAAPAGYVSYPQSRAYQLSTGRVSCVKLKVYLSADLSALSDSKRAAVRMMKYEDGVWTDITVAYADGKVAGETTGNSIFALMAPVSMFDKLGPVTTLTAANVYAGGTADYVAAGSSVTLTAVDRSSSAYVIAGVAAIYYLLDVDATQACAVTAYDPSAPAGTCANKVYTGPFALNEGVHAIYYVATDKAGNYGDPAQRVLYADGTAPVTTVVVAGAPVTGGADVYAAEGTSITLTGTDPITGGVASGVAHTNMLVDVSEEDCAGTEAVGGINGAGSCENPYYDGPFTLPAGEHTLYYYSTDNVGNEEAEHSVRVLVSTANSSLDIMPPVTTISYSGASYGSGPVYISSLTEISLAAYDDAISSGDRMGTVTQMYYSVDSDSYSVYAGTFSIADGGTHVMRYFGIDLAGNTEEVKTSSVTVDNSAPVTVFNVQGSSSVINGSLYITAASSVVITATDALSGVKAIYYSVDAAFLTSTAITYTSPFMLGVGTHSVTYTATDHVGNQASMTVIDINIATSTDVAVIMPSSGPIGVPFTIVGTGFGTYSSGITNVLIGGTTVPLTLWSSTIIRGTVPGTLAAGEHSVVLMRGTTTITDVAPFTVTVPTASAVTPSSGAIGLPFAITGESFGNYVANYTRVLIGGATAPLTLWTDGKIQGTVPGSLAAGEYELVVERELNGGKVSSTPRAFQVVTPQLDAIVPTYGAIGIGFTLTGANFGNYVANYTRVLIGGATAPLTLWADGKIQGTVPGTLPSGTYAVAVERELNGGLVRSSTVAFSLVLPEAQSVTPSSGAIGLPFTITGTHFGNYVANFTRVLIGGATTPVTLWTDTRIQGTVPGGLTAGNYELIVERELNGGRAASLPLAFEVLGVNVSSITPVSGPIGLPFTIYGSNFGNYSAGYTKVLMGGTTMPITLWTNVKIQGTVPGSLADGDYPVVVERNLNGGVVQSSSLTFTVASPAVYTLSPSSGPIGLPFTITGLNFGNYSAGYTKVLIGGATAPLTLWSDTKVQGTIPGALAAGEHELYLERALNGGVVRSATTTFTVGAPYIENVNPSTASVQAAYALAGYNFGNYSAGYTKVLVNGSTTAVTLWTDGKIQGKLPSLPAGTYPVQVQRFLNGGLSESATSYITVVEPVISSMTPVSGLARATINLYGSGFGTYESGFTKLLMDGTTCAISLWNDTRITGTVPAALAYGTHTVVAARGMAYSNGADFLLTAYTASMLKTITALGEFSLGEVYVYPNPAKGGAVPIFHIECGTADSVKIEVYTISGQAVHEYTITGAPQLITDSSGASYAYEYAWRGHIASGVYLYRIEAERSGRKLKKTGKFAVVR